MTREVRVATTTAPTSQSPLQTVRIAVQAGWWPARLNTTTDTTRVGRTASTPRPRVRRADEGTITARVTSVIRTARSTRASGSPRPASGTGKTADAAES